MEKEKTPKIELRQAEVKEKEKLPPIAFIYRENDLFKEWIPVMVNNLKNMDRRAEIHEFPRGTEEAEIQEWLIENQEKFKDKDISVDGTVREELFNSGFGRNHLLKYEPHYIDDILSDFSSRVFFGKNKKELQKETEYAKTYEGSLETCEKSFVVIIERILKNAEPKRINIFLSNILDHEPFSKKPDNKENEAKNREIAKEQIGGWFIKGGVDRKQIAFNPEENYKKIKESIEKKKGSAGNWLVFDRHLLGGLEERLGKIKTDSIKLQLPLGNFLQDAINNSLLQIDSSKAEEELKQILKKEFAKARKIRY
jgi:hypothetical protein